MNRYFLIPLLRRVRPALFMLLLSLPLAAGAVTLEQAVAQVRQQTGGRILSAETVKENGHRVHRIKVLTPDRTVRTVRVEAGKGK